MRIGEWGIFYRFATGFDISGFSALSITFTKPDGTLLVVTNPAVTAPNVDVVTTQGLFPANTYAQYRFMPGDVNQSGEWCAFVTYDDGSQHLISDPSDFTVDPAGCTE